VLKLTPKQQGLSNLTVEQLLERFAALGVDQDKAKNKDDMPSVKCLFWEIQAVVTDLKSRPGDQRRTLTSLYDYPNMNVRLKAAKATLAVAPQAARRAIEAIAASTWPPQCYDARMCLAALDDGIFKPD
jgi:Domain of unknown function (DUF2019)